MTRLILFDVEGTLLDLSGLDVELEAVFGQDGLRPEWSALVVRRALIDAATGFYEDFDSIALAVLEDMARRRGIVLDADSRERLGLGLPGSGAPLPVREGLHALAEAGLTLGCLTNKTEKAAEEALDCAGVADFFDAVISTERMGCLKPSTDVYVAAACTLGRTPGDVRVVGTQDWDVLGGLQAGCAAALVTPDFASFAHPVCRPDVVGPDLHTVAQRILEVEVGPSMPG